jgi:hypothetical protein
MSSFRRKVCPPSPDFGGKGVIERAVVTLSLISACARTSTPPTDAEPASSETGPSVVTTSPRPLVDAGLARHRLNLSCRAMAVTGSPTIAVDGGGSRPLAMNDFADGWVTLGAADTLTVTLPRSGRELTFVGPALVAPCVTADEAWVLRGRFQGARGSGESPGAEEWVVTPFGVVRYGAAIVEVTVDDTGAWASLKGGSATILPEGESAWQILRQDTRGVVPPVVPRVMKGAPLGKPLGSEASQAASERCAKASAAAKTLEDALLLPDATASPAFGDLAMRANDAHVLGRALCAVAKLREDALRTR